MERLTRRTLLIAAPTAFAFTVRPAGAAKQYGPGITDAEIKIGNTCFYTGPASSYSTIGKSMAAYYKMVNDQGGVNGRKIKFISYDDAYSPPKTVEQTRRLVEEDQILLDAGPLGTPTNSAIWHYMNQKKVPQLFVSTGATKWDDPKGHPGRSAGSRTTKARDVSTRPISSRKSRTRRSACCTRTTISARTT